jgi:hypothetical protein
LRPSVVLITLAIMLVSAILGLAIGIARFKEERVTPFPVSISACQGFVIVGVSSRTLFSLQVLTISSPGVPWYMCWLTLSQQYTMNLLEMSDHQKTDYMQLASFSPNWVCYCGGLVSSHPQW